MKHYLFILLVICYSPVFAQTNEQISIDQLLKQLPAAGNDTHKIRLLDELSFLYSHSNPTEGLKYAIQALQLSRQLSWQRGIATAHSDMGINYQALGNYHDALIYQHEALKLYMKAGSKRSIAGVLSNIALAYMGQSDYTNALNYNFRALTINEELDDKPTQAVILENIGSVYSAQKIYTKASEYYSMALRINKTLNNTPAVARNYGNIGMVLDAAGKYDEALQAHLQALKGAQEGGNKHMMQINLANIGYVYCHKKDYPKALDYQQEALALSREINNKESIAINLGNIGETYYAMAMDTLSRNKNSQFAKAITYLDEAITKCKELGFNAPLAEYEEYLSRAYYRLARYKEAFNTMQEYVALKDSIFSMERLVQMNNLETQREIALKDKNLLLKDKQIQIRQLQVQQKRNESLLYILGMALLLIVVGIVLRSLYRFRKRNRLLSNEKEEYLRKLEKRNQLLEEIAHIQSHDIRGPVATILGLAQNFNFKNTSDPNNKVVIEGITAVTEQLDEIVKYIITRENNLEE